MGWMSRKWGWAKQKPFFWWSLLLAGVTLVLVFVSPGPILFTGPSDLRLRLWGLGLQLIGVATVWSDLTSTARKFGRDGIIRAIVDWLKAFLAQHRVIEVPLAEMMVAADTVRAKVRRPIVSTAPLPDRVTAVEINIQKIDQDLDTVHKEIDAAIDDVKARISVEATHSRPCASRHQGQRGRHRGG